MDLTMAYSAADLDAFKALLARFHLADILKSMSDQMKGGVAFTQCPTGAESVLTSRMTSVIAMQDEQFKADMASGFQPPFSHADLILVDRYVRSSGLRAAPLKSLPAGKPQTAKQLEESTQLAETAAVARFVKTFGSSMAPMMEQLAEEQTAALHEVCPELKDVEFHSTGLQSQNDQPGSPFQ